MRRDLILTRATETIESGGFESLKMSDLARSAKISIGSLYQYFRDRSAVVRALAERYVAEGYACVSDAFTGAIDRYSLADALEMSVRGYYRMFLQQPVMCDDWFGAQTDRSLQPIAEADIRQHAVLLEEALGRIDPTLPNTKDRALFVMQALDATVRFAVGLAREEEDSVIEQFCATLIPAALTDVSAPSEPGRSQI